MYSLQPFLIDAKKAHVERIVRYETDGNIVLTQPLKIIIPPEKQFPAIRATFEDLNTSLSALANSPLLDNQQSLRQLYDKEVEVYESMVAETYAKGGWEPDYGTYVFDQVTNDLYLIAPKFWHRLALVTSNSKLLTDPEGKLSWQEIRSTLENKVVGFAGASVGGNIIEGWLREARAKQIKIADPDFVGATNFNRGERMSLRHLVKSRASRKDLRNPYYTPRVLKAEYIAYEQQLVDPYLETFIYKEGLNEENIERFFLGNGTNEPKIDLFVEEMDDFWLKYRTREFCKKHKIPVLMLSDFGNRVQVQFQDFKKHPTLDIGYQRTDKEVESLVKKVISGGNREDVWEYVRALCGNDFAADEFGAWVQGKGEQPTASLPQSGATAMSSGGIGGKMLTLHFLGHTLPERVIFDLRHRKIIM